ncbi:hypothetical protein CONLIGDRAFT_679764 [Coniochaeta ligniaria NRRL 30616]|uniref:Uncharacterized protein n=1 Tax=Coniochaeta ligniaria NRRL 30616 TaxID=1408157 RepID=A0A1J7JTG9_9PEZI|nr:hypothetical protein CONLIGDRAFT_679764 [Coniochaeta ligniaria NRRL 30616]
MSGDKSTGPGWMANLPFSPKKHKAYEDKLGAERPAKFDRRITDFFQKMPQQAKEIPDSDSDALGDDDDDVELPSLNALLKTTGPSTKPAFTFRSSQSSLEPSPQKKWADFMAIIKDGEEAKELDKMQDSATSDNDSSPIRGRSDKLEGRALLKQAVNIAQDEDGGDDSDKEQHFARVRQAMDRQAAAHTTPCYYFFAPVNERSLAPGTPNRLSLGALKAANHTHQVGLSVQSKLATKYLGDPGINLPDELLDWILDVFPTERSEAVRAEYRQILTQRPLEVGRLITEKKLKQWFISIGADEHAISHRVQARSVGQREAPKTSRDWTPFRNIMELLRHCCGWLTVDTLIHAAVFLLRAAMDSELRIQANLATIVNDTLATLAANCPDDEREKFCRKVCNLFVQTVDSVNLLSRAIEATNHVESRLLNTPRASRDFNPFKDLRTRLRLSVFFKDAEKATPERCGTAQALLQSILQRLDEPDFKGRVGGRGVTNYYDLDGYGMALTEIIPFLHHLRQPITDKAEVSDFNRSVDDLRRKISFVTSTIQTVGSMDDFDARYEAKSRWQALDYCISHFFPRPGGTGVFSEERTAEEAEEASRRVEKQQSFMSNFLQKARAGNA